MTQNDPGRSREGGEPAGAVHHTPTKIWVMVALITVGFSLGTLAFPVRSVPLFVVGAVIFLAASAGAFFMGILENVH